MAVIFNSKAIIPSPLITIAKSYNTRGDGTPISTNYEITLEGTLLPSRGSPDSEGVFVADTGGAPPDETDIDTTDEKFNSIRRKQEAIRDLFNNDSTTYNILEWSPEGSPTTKCSPIVQSINFTPGSWVQRSDYTIRLTANRLFHGGVALTDDFGDLEAYNLVNASDQWSLREEEDDTGEWVITHTISATARRHFGDQENFDNDSDLNDAWIAAKNWVASKMTNTIPTSIFDLSTYNTVNRNRQETFDQQAGSYSITDTFRASNESLNVKHLYTVRHETETGQLQVNLPGLGTRNKYTISGTIQGYYPYSEQPSFKYTLAAQVFWNTHLMNSGSQHYIITLIKNALYQENTPASEKPSINSRPIASVITRDPTKGTIAYTLTFDDATTNFTGISNTQFNRYDIKVTDNNFTSSAWSVDNLGITSLAVIPIPGRASGPIIQDLGTRPVMTRTINGTCYLKKKIDGYTFWDKDALNANLQRMKDDFFQILSNEKYSIFHTDFDSHLTAFNHSFDNKVGSYTASVTYTITPT